MSHMDLDRTLIGSVVEMVMRRTRNLGTWPALERESGVSRAALDRVRTGQMNVSHATFHRVEAGLGLPVEALQTLGMHDWDAATGIGVPDEVITWARRNAT